MARCTRCGGTGSEVYDDGDERVEAICSHCEGTGNCTDYQSFIDSLASVALAMAHTHVSGLKDNANSDPEGEDFAFQAAENMMAEYDYFRVKVWEYASIFETKLMALTFDKQNEYIEKHSKNEYIEPLPLTYSDVEGDLS